MKAKVLPRITVLIVTLNNRRTLETCLKAVSTQDYPKHLVELLNVDGGSTDETLSILKRYGFRSVRSTIPGNAEAQRGIGLKLAKNNLIASLDADNYLPSNQWFREMVQPFMDDPDMVHANTLHYHHEYSDTIYNRYCALFGVVDPIVYYIGRPDRVVQFQKNWKLGQVVKETPAYFSVNFNLENLPTVGCNGVVYRRDLLLKHAQSSPEQFLHIDVFADLVAKGFTRFAVVKNDLTHDTAVSLPALMKKRIAFLSGYYLKNTLKRRYLIHNPQKFSDQFKLVLFVLYTVTFIKPILDSAVGYYYIRDPAWFLHPIICWIYLYAYGVASIKKLLLRFHT